MAPLNHLLAILLLCTLGNASPGLAQAEDCRFVDVFTYAVNRSAMNEYSSYIRKLGGFPHWGENGPMGVFLLTQFVNEKGQECWYLETCLDDRYKEQLWTHYAFYNGTLVLINYGDSTGRVIRPAVSSPGPEGNTMKRRMACIEAIVGDRVYVRPARVKRMIYEQRTPAGPMAWFEQKVAITGNPYGRALITFRGDGTFTIQVDA